MRWKSLRLVKEDQERSRKYMEDRKMTKQEILASVIWQVSKELKDRIQKLRFPKMTVMSVTATQRT